MVQLDLIQHVSFACQHIPTAKPYSESEHLELHGKMPLDASLRNKVGEIITIVEEGPLKESPTPIPPISAFGKTY